MTTRKKLIEVALPLDAINNASAREKSIRHGHPSTLHLWWARRPLAAARAVIFAQMMDDPSSWPDLFPTEKAQEKERRRLFKIIEDMVQWENTTNETVLERARTEIWQSWRRTCAENADHPRAKELFDRHKLPAFHDPFAGGGALPLEAQRLGLEAYASDLNPVAVLINKAMIEIPPKFADRPPVNPESRRDKNMFDRDWKGAQGLAEDVRYYGKWMRDQAEKRIGRLYPKIEITPDMAAERPDLKKYVGRSLTVIAWLWARTVKSPNPAFATVDVPLASTFMLSTKPGKEAYVEPVILPGSESVSLSLKSKDLTSSLPNYRFTVKMGKPENEEAAKRGTKLARGANFQCLMSGSPISGDYIKAEGRAGRMGTRMMAIVAEGDGGRVYLPPTPEHEAVAREAKPEWKPETDLVGKCRDQLPLYGMNTFGDLFTPRQLVALTTFSDLVGEAKEQVRRDALEARREGRGERSESSPLTTHSSDLTPLSKGGAGASAYAEAVGVYLGFALSKHADLGNSLCRWEPVAQCPRQLFGRQAIPMIWDFAEGNSLGESSGAWAVFVDGIVRSFSKCFEDTKSTVKGSVLQADASAQTISCDKLISTDPPYYDNIGYADLSDFFYVWLRRSLRSVFPDLFVTLAVPKAEELVATPYRHGSKDKAEKFFLDGMTQAMRRLAEQTHPAFPVTIYYAFKQSETTSAPLSNLGEGPGVRATGWETFLAAVIRAGFAITGTWPMRTENSSRLVGMDTNALASSIVLVCRRCAADAPTTTRREFINTLKTELPVALRLLQGLPLSPLSPLLSLLSSSPGIAPVDLAQAAIGPGMAIYTRYARVLDAEGKPLSVRDALTLINQTLDETLAEQEGDFDADSRWALAWFEQCGFAEGEYGVAETLSKAKNTSVSGMVEAGIVASRAGKVRLLKSTELPSDWDPATDKRLTAWETVHHLIRALETGGETATAELVTKLGSKADTARELCYRLYTICERKKRPAEALAYNGLVQSWTEIGRQARDRSPQNQQASLFDQE